MIDSKTLGKRIRFFRQRAKLSQMELEVAMNASAGVVSRIENGTVNPTKETIQNIADRLKMHQREIDYLIGVTAQPASDKEVAMAIEDVSDYLNREDVFAYLMDERWRFLYISKGFVNLLNGTTKDVEGLVGKTAIEALIEDHGILTKYMDKSTFESTIEFQLKHYYSEVFFMQDDYYFQRTEEKIKANPKLKQVWEKVTVENIFNYNPREWRTIYFKTPLGTMPMRYGREPLLNYPRFDITEYSIIHE